MKNLWQSYKDLWSAATTDKDSLFAGLVCYHFAALAMLVGLLLVSIYFSLVGTILSFLMGASTLFLTDNLLSIIEELRDEESVEWRLKSYGHIPAPEMPQTSDIQCFETPEAPMNDAREVVRE